MTSTLIQVDLNALVQGVVIAIGIISLAVVYFDRLSSISSDVGQLSDSIEGIEEDIRKVDFKQMERTVTKLDYALDSSSLEEPNPGSFQSGDNTVYDHLEKSGVEIAISYGGVEHEVKTRDTIWDKATTVQIEFDEQVDIQALIGRLADNEDLANLEEKMFEQEIMMRGSPPFEVSLVIPEDDIEKISEFMSEYINHLDESVQIVESKSKKFDEYLEKHINSQ